MLDLIEWRLPMSVHRMLGIAAPFVAATVILPTSSVVSRGPVSNAELGRAAVVMTVAVVLIHFGVARLGQFIDLAKERFRFQRVRALSALSWALWGTALCIYALIAYSFVLPSQPIYDSNETRSIVLALLVGATVLGVAVGVVRRMTIWQMLAYNVGSAGGALWCAPVLVGYWYWFDPVLVGYWYWYWFDPVFVLAWLAIATAVLVYARRVLLSRS